jgi:hypothetical protein
MNAEKSARENTGERTDDYDEALDCLIEAVGIESVLARSDRVSKATIPTVTNRGMTLNAPNLDRETAS